MGGVRWHRESLREPRSEGNAGMRLTRNLSVTRDGAPRLHRWTRTAQDS